MILNGFLESRSGLQTWFGLICFVEKLLTSSKSPNRDERQGIIGLDREA